jgi:hypothetical protein
VTNLIRLDGEPGDNSMNSSAVTGISALRLITGMDADEFAGALSKELGWAVPLFVYLQWERDEGVDAPPEALDAARKLGLRYRIGKRAPGLSRRQFLGGVAGLSALTAVGFPIGTQSLAGTLSSEGSATKRRISDETAADLERLTGSYRRAYAGKAAVADLLPGATGLMHLLIDMRRSDQWPGSHARLASLVGQSAVLAGLLHLMGPRDLNAARDHYSLALQAPGRQRTGILPRMCLDLSRSRHGLPSVPPTDEQSSTPPGIWLPVGRTHAPALGLRRSPPNCALEMETNLRADG